MVVFSSAAAVQRMVAGLPAGARALRSLAQAGCERAVLLAPGLAQPEPILLREARRLSGAMAFSLAEPGQSLAELAGETPVVPGEALLDGTLPDLALARRLDSGPESLAPLPEPLARRACDAASVRIIKATSKPGDGIVSRWLNRPVSQACTRLLLRLFPTLAPLHATFGTAAISVAMSAALLTGSQAGLVVGALLFQAASIFDGVDGEIARATFRSSPQGAALDSLIDALTNLACVAGVVWNLYCQGLTHAAMAGAVGLLMMGIGLAVLGQRSRKNVEGMTFNAVKDRFNQRPSLIRQWLVWLTMRDFYALAAAVLIASGFATFALYAFAVVSVGWLMVVLAMMRREQG